MRLIQIQDNFGQFTDEDKDKLTKLVEKHGRNFALIGKLMEKRPRKNNYHIFALCCLSHFVSGLI
jgi:phytoene/squalene synthetase